jgi:hypothetical protein
MTDRYDQQALELCRKAAEAVNDGVNEQTADNPFELDDAAKAISDSLDLPSLLRSRDKAMAAAHHIRLPACMTGYHDMLFGPCKCGAWHDGEHVAEYLSQLVKERDEWKRQTEGSGKDGVK